MNYRTSLKLRFPLPWSQEGIIYLKPRLFWLAGYMDQMLLRINMLHLFKTIVNNCSLYCASFMPNHVFMPALFDFHYIYDHGMYINVQLPYECGVLASFSDQYFSLQWTIVSSCERRFSRKILIF